jgi:hypothetical protein
MIRIIFSILLFIPCVVFGQDYIEYQRAITKAEKFILDSNYRAAINIYDSVFVQYDFAFAEHCFTAARTAVVAGNNPMAANFLKRCIAQGPPRAPSLEFPLETGNLDKVEEGY